MTATRRHLSRKLRFEIFKRDGFTCRYCGSKPPEVILEVDHAQPVAAGGEDDELNLVTSCFTCNRGKGARPLGDVRPMPDAEEMYLETQQQVAEAQRYLQSKAARDQAMHALLNELQEVWHEHVGGWSYLDDVLLRQWLTRYPVEDVEDAITIAGRKRHYGQLANTTAVKRYVWGILRKKQRDREEAEDVFSV